MTPESEEALLANLHGIYSDVYKSKYGMRPRLSKFDTVENIEAAIDELQSEIELDLETDVWFDDQARMQNDMDTQVHELQPNPGDAEHFPKRSGMGRRFESKMRLRNRIRKLVQEKYRIDLPAVTIPSNVAELLSDAHKRIVETRRLLEAAKIDTLSDNLKEQIEQLLFEFINKNDSVVGGLVDLLEREQSVHESKITQHKKANRKLIIKKKKC